MQIIEVGTASPKRGFSTFKFLPGTSDQVRVVVLASHDYNRHPSIYYESVCLSQTVY